MIYGQQLIDNLTYSNVTAKVAQYSPLITYGIGDEVRVDKFIYKSVASNNLDKNPIENLGVFWIKWASSNEYALLDLDSETLTEWSGTGIIEFTRGGKDTIAIGNFKASTITIEYLDNSNGVVNGMTIETSVTLSSSITSGLAYVNNKRIDLSNTAKTFTASKDTYVDLTELGALVYNEVSNGGAVPTISGTNQRLAKVVTDSDNITSVTDLRTVINNVIDTETYNFITYMSKINLYQYIYGAFNETNSLVVYQNLKRKGTTIRVTFSNNGNETNCGYCIGTIAVNCGKTLENVTFPDRRIGNETINIANFNTIIDKNLLMTTMNSAKKLINEPMLFVVDTSTDSVFNNMVFIATINKCDAVASNQEKNELSWELQQSKIL